ncbi:MAG TPA: glycosyltransferase [Acidobacteriota bacterium]|nr:glycosyltransferase [Acidobacteriota bacterium]
MIHDWWTYLVFSAFGKVICDIIPTRNSLNLIRQCLSSILEKTDYPNYEILLVDNGSDDPQTLAYLDFIGKRPAPPYPAGRPPVCRCTGRPGGLSQRLDAFCRTLSPRIRHARF